MKNIFRGSLAFLVLLASCTSSKITSTWKAENIQPVAYKKILVLGLINEPDRTVRENMETNIVAQLNGLGYTAVCSCDEFGPTSFLQMTEKEALAKLNNSGIDAVLTVVLLEKTKERQYVPGRVINQPIAYGYDRFWGYYHTMYGLVYTPGYYVTNTRYFWETNFYKMESTNQLLYSASSQSFDPPDAKTLSSEYAGMIIKNMMKWNVIAKQVVRS